jgi:TPR repeat protein
LKIKFAIYFSILTLFISSNAKACELGNSDYKISIMDSQSPPSYRWDGRLDKDTLELIEKAKTIFVGEEVLRARTFYLFRITHPIKNAKKGYYYSVRSPWCWYYKGTRAMIADDDIFPAISPKAAKQIKTKFGLIVPVIALETNTASRPDAIVELPETKLLEHIKELQESARKGDRTAPLFLAHYFSDAPYHGLDGLARDEAKAYFWLKVANLSGDIAADIPASSLEVPANQKAELDKEAIKWFNTPAESRAPLPDPLPQPAPQKPTWAEKIRRLLR